jgi:HEAT repeat protein
MAASILLFWLGEFVITGNWFYYMMLAWFNVLYLVNNLEFWGLAAQLYDVRQSKRLFGVISSGDIPAKFLGYSIALLVIPYIGTQNLLLAGFLGMLFSLFFVRNIFHSAELSEITVHTHKIKHHQTAGFSAMLHNITGNKLIMRTAILSMLAFAGFVLIEYAFYAEIKESDRYRSDVSFAAFIALFMASARLVGWIFKLGFTSRVVASIGNRNSLLITPIAVFLLIITVLITFSYNQNSRLILYVFGAAAILVDALRASINSPVLLTILQPLSTPERLKAHNIVKGIMDPFAYLFIGVLLLLLYKWNLYQLIILCYIIITLSLIWALYVFLIQKQYLKTLIQTISSRYFTKEEFNLNEKETLERIAEKMHNGTELEVLYLLQMLGDDKGSINEQLIATALKHASANVCIAALDIVQQKQLTAIANDIKELISTTAHSAVKSKAIQVHSSLAFDHAFISPFLSSADLLLQQAAITGIVQYGKTEAERRPAVDLLKQLFSSGDASLRIAAINSLSGIASPVFEKDLERLLNDPNKEVQKTAIRSIGPHSDKQTLSQLANLFSSHEKEITAAFVKAGSKSLDTIKELLFHQPIDQKQRQRLILACGRITGRQAQQFLLDLFQHFPDDSYTIIKALNRSGFHVDEKNTGLVDSITHDHLLRSVEILFMLNRSRATHEIKKFMHDSLQLELLNIRETLLNLFSFYSDKEQVDKIKKALYLNKKEIAANALELIEVTIKKEHASTFNTAFEDIDLAFRCTALKKLLPENAYADMQKVITRVLKEDNACFNHWTKACSLHTSKHSSLNIDRELIHIYFQSENILLRETAAYAAV